MTRPSLAALAGPLTLLTIGWTGLLIPSLIRSIQGTFGQGDDGIGLVYLLYNATYAGASFAGGALTERMGRRRVLTGAALLHGAGIAAFGAAPDWTFFLAATIPAGLGAGVLDGGSNGLYLDLFRSRRGRAMNLLHLFFSLGALSAPVVVGTLVGAGTPWQAVMVATAVALVPLAGLFAIAAMPDGRRHRGTAGGHAGPSVDRPSARGRLAGPTLLLGLGIATYVASEVGVSNWLVRFLDPAPLETATLALSLYWAGLAVGRLVSARLADRYDHVPFTMACAVAMAVAVAGAVLAPALELSIALFTIAGLASGPIFPMIVAIGGERSPDRAAAVSGMLTGFGVAGGLVYPPLMGVLSVTVGLTVAMLGTAALALLSAGALVAVGRRGDQPAG